MIQAENYQFGLFAGNLVVLGPVAIDISKLSVNMGNPNTVSSALKFFAKRSLKSGLFFFTSFHVAVDNIFQVICFGKTFVIYQMLV